MSNQRTDEDERRLQTYMLLNKATVAAVEFALEDMTTFGSRKVAMLHFQTTASLPLYIGTELPCETVLVLSAMHS